MMDMKLFFFLLNQVTTNKTKQMMKFILITNLLDNHPRKWYFVSISAIWPNEAKTMKRTTKKTQRFLSRALSLSLQNHFPFISYYHSVNESEREKKNLFHTFHHTFKHFEHHHDRIYLIITLFTVVENQK